jgi:hypothetical protein
VTRAKLSARIALVFALAVVALPVACDGCYDMREEYQRWKQGDRNAFIDPEGYRAFNADRGQAFEDKLKRQEAGKM